MDVAEELFDRIFSSVDLQRECADKLIKLAKELEEHKKNVNISKVAGSSAAVGGAAAMTAAGVVAICTAGAAIPFLAAAGVAGAVVSGLGAATSIGSEVTCAVISSRTMKEAEKISEQIQNAKEEIQELMESLKEEGNKRERQDNDDDDSDDDDDDDSDDGDDDSDDGDDDSDDDDDDSDDGDDGDDGDSDDGDDDSGDGDDDSDDGDGDDDSDDDSDDDDSDDDDSDDDDDDSDDGDDDSDDGDDDSDDGDDDSDDGDDGDDGDSDDGDDDSGDGDDDSDDDSDDDDSDDDDSDDDDDDSDDGDVDDYVVERILRAMAKHSGLVLNDKINLHDIMTFLSKSEISGKDTAFSLLGESLHGLALLSKFVIQAAAKKSVKIITSTGFAKMAASMGTKTAAKAVGRVGGGAVGLLFSVPELFIDVKNLIKDNCKTEASQSLRENAEALKTASKEMKQQLDNIKNVLDSLAEVQHSVENSNRSSGEKKTLIMLAMKYCEDEAVRRWLRVNSESDAFSQLVEMFNFLKKHIDEEKKKDHSNNVHITFVAHGSIRDSMIPASRLLPLLSITDVILYSPWNCVINANVAYGVATGHMKPKHRKFYCRKKVKIGKNKYIECKIPHEGHQPTKLPDHWNSMKKAGHQMIPNIMLSPLYPPEDGAWERFEFLQDRYGQPGRNHIIVPFILPAEKASSVRVPFFIVTLALSLALLLSGFKATVHLAACLGDRSAEEKFDQEYLKRQYACTIDNTGMHSSLNLEDVHLNPDLYRAFKAMFG